MKKMKKSRFWTFCFSFLPGAAEMYMGFMKMGVSLLSLFFVSIFIAYFINIGPLLCVTCIIWFYSFFHARNMARLTAAELEQVEDEYVVDFERVSTSKVKNAFTNQTVLAWFFIIIGGYMLWKGFIATMMFAVPDAYFYRAQRLTELAERLVLGALIIWFGVRVMKGKKVEIIDSVSQVVTATEIKENQETKEEAKVVLSKGAQDEKGGEAVDGAEKENA